jgi:hypothetical protein
LNVCCDLRLLVVGRDGTGGDVVRHDIALPFRAAPYGADLGWGPTGLIAVSPPFPEHPEEGDEGNWVTVVDAAAGAGVATVDGWVGTAWSPDGSGLLVGRPSGPEESRLVILHGAALDERTDVGAVPGAFTPRDWRPPVEATERDTASGEGAPTGDGTGTPPTHDGAPTDGGLLTGTLAGTPDCLWLTAGDGARYALVLPPGSTTRTDGDAVVLVDGDGADIARKGDDIEVRGGYLPGETSCPEADATGPAIVAGGVQAG